MTISSALYQAILSARQSNPTAYSNVASNYLIGAGLSNSQAQQIASTGTFNIVTSSGNYNVQPTSSGVNAVPITNTLSGIVSKFLGPSLPSTTGTNLPGSTAGPNTQTVANGVGLATSNSLTGNLNTGLVQIEGFFKNHPELILIGGGLAVLLILKK